MAEMQLFIQIFTFFLSFFMNFSSQIQTLPFILLEQIPYFKYF